jgi:hypothetical protein
MFHLLYLLVNQLAHLGKSTKLGNELQHLFSLTDSAKSPDLSPWLAALSFGFSRLILSQFGFAKWSSIRQAKP